MLFLYNSGIQIYRLLVLLASLKSKKARSWIQGRKGILHQIESQISPGKSRIWFHFASLGEFEQGRPVLEELKSRHPKSSIVVTFFSPSGYEVRKNYTLADHVFYLPLDTRQNAATFISLVNPSLAVFTKYEYWYHFFSELDRKAIPLFIVSGLFREDQPFFKWYGRLHRKMLLKVSHFFVQNELSKKLLNNLGFINVTVTGDTRFDRVVNHIKHAARIPEIEDFCSGRTTFIAGSTWPQDEGLIAPLAGKYPDWKFIIAPHEISEAHVKEVKKAFSNSVCLSELKPVDYDKQVLIIDSIGLLSTLYQYGDIAYIGGGFGAGLHNTQEASAFGLPVIFGPKYHQFIEAVELMEQGASFSINNLDELANRVKSLENADTRATIGDIASKYVAQKAGATQMIVEYLENEKFLN